MIYADSHCDTITKIYNTTAEPQDLYSNDMDFSIANAVSGDNKHLQTFALFVDTTAADERKLSPYERFKVYTQFYRQTMCENSDTVMHCTSCRDIENAFSLQKVAAVLAIENGAVFEGKIENIKKAYEHGVRLVTLTWNDPNEIGIGAKYADFNVPDTGLTDFGLKCIKECENIGIGIDVSHLSPQTFADVLNNVKKPVFATHSCCSAINRHCRNLDDKQLKILADNGAYIGICLYGEFLGEEYSKVTTETVADHIEHAIKICGSENVGFGSDFDGFSDKYFGYEGVNELQKICKIMLSRGYPEAVVRGIAGENYIRHLRQLFNGDVRLGD